MTFFSAANPSIYLGGMLDERKSDIYKLIPKANMPTTKIVRPNEKNKSHKILSTFKFPIVIKPNIGYKGFMVKKIDTIEELEANLNFFQEREIVVQEFLAQEHEYAVMYFYINETNFGVSSLIEKHLPSIKGNGRNNVRQLISQLNNPFLNKAWVLSKHHNILESIPAQNAVITIDHVGNYSRGSSFEDLNHCIDSKLVAVMKNFFGNLKGMNFCRIDLKADSLEDLRSGKFKVLEINGAKSEPLHIYDPRVSILDIFKAIHLHWKILFKVVQANIRDLHYPSSLDGIKAYFSLKKLMN